MRHNLQRKIDYPQHQTRTGLFDLDLVRATQTHWDINGLFIALASLVGRDSAIRLFRHYNVGTSSWWGGSTVFWLSDSSHPGDCFLTGHIFKTDPSTGHSTLPYFTTVHDRLKDFNGIDVGLVPKPLPLIGSHLVHRDHQKPIIITRHPIAAMVGYHIHSGYNWLSIGDLDFIDLTCPWYTNQSLPGSAPVILLAEPEDEALWSEVVSKLNTLMVFTVRRLLFLPASTLPNHRGNLMRTLLNYPQDVKTKIQNICTQL